MYILKSTLDEILAVIGKSPIESGGIIGCRDGCICAFVFDEAYTSQNEYRPNVEYLNAEIQKWNAEGISFCGIIHSHLYGFDFPSESDRIYAQKLFTFGANITTLLFPIVTIDGYNEPQIAFYKFSNDSLSFVKLALRMGG